MDIANSRTRGADAPERVSEFPAKWRGPQRSDETAHHQALATVAHELRLPLSHIKGFVTSLRRADIEWDEETRKVFSPDAWHENRLKSWAGDVPDISSQIIVEPYKKDELVRAITLGMKKAGLPDVVMDALPWASEHQVGNLINVFCQSMVEGAVFEKSGKVNLDLRAIHRGALHRGKVCRRQINGRMQCCAGNEARRGHAVVAAGNLPEEWKKGNNRN